MTSVADNETDIVLGRKLQCLGHMSRGRDIDCISNKISKGARLGNRVVWITGSIGEKGGHKRRGRLIAASY